MLTSVEPAQAVQGRSYRLQDALVTGLPILGLFLASRVLMYLVFSISKSDFRAEVFSHSLCQWDCNWYLSIMNGYQLSPSGHIRGDAANWAFFPLYPLISSVVGKLLSIPHLTAGLVVSNAATLAAGFTAGMLFPDRRTVLTFCFLLFFGPLSFYFASVYTEGLFFLLTVICLHLLSRRQYLAAAASAALLSATRPTGVFMSLAIVAGALRDHLSDGYSLKSFPRVALANPQLVLATFLAPIGLFIYMTYLYAHIGDALAFAHIQRAWEHQLYNPLKLLAQGLSSKDLMRVETGAESAEWGALWALIGLALTGYLVWLRRVPEAVFTSICIILPLATGMAGMARYVVGLAPFAIAVSEFIASRRILMLIALPILGLIDVPLLVLWGQGAKLLP